MIEKTNSLPGRKTHHIEKRLVLRQNNHRTATEEETKDRY